MPNTPRLALRYPALTDSPNGPLAVQNLGLDVESWLNRAFPCTSTTRPSSPLQGMMIYETDTGEWRGWTGAAWEVIGGETGEVGGGGGQTVVADAQYSATGNQSVPLNTDTVVAFGTANLSSDYIVRYTRGVGHEFELTIGGLYSAACTLRYPGAGSGPTGTMRSRLMSTASATEPIIEDEIHDDTRPTTLSWSITRRFAAGARIYVATRNTSSTARALDRGVNGSTVRLNLALVGR